MGHHVLVVDDALYSRVTVSNYLKARGFTVSCATNGEEAILAVRRERIDLILMDIVMPVMDGLTAIRFLKNNEHSRDIPIIILSAHKKNEQIKAALKSGADGYLQKPVTPEEIHHRIVQVLAKEPVNPKRELNEGFRKFIQLFEDDNIFNRYQAAESLIKFGEKITPDLQSTVLNGTRNQRYFALLTLGKLRDVNSISTIASALEDKDPHIRRLAAELLGTLEAQKGLQALNRSLGRDSELPWVKRLIDWAIDRINS